MITVVVCINLALALILLYVAWRVWRLRLQLAQITANLSLYERSVNDVLSGAPNAILIGREGIHQLRLGNQPLDLELVRIQQVLTLFGIGRQIWQRSRLLRGSKFLRTTLTKYNYK